MAQRLALLILAALSFLLTSCATDSDRPTTEQNQSSIPWNRPEKWEGQGMIPGFSGTQ